MKSSTQTHYYQSSVSLFLKFTLLSVIFLLGWSALNAQDPTPYQIHKMKVSKKVYKDIARTVKDGRKPPTFNFIYTDYEPIYNAYYDPSNHTINMEEGIFDLAKTFGKDSLNVLAMVLGHETAHFYKDHGWGWSFGMANADLEIADKIYDLQLSSESRAQMEAEADYFGGLFGYLAGYQTLDIGPEFFDKLYLTIGIPDETFGYPSRQDRMAIVNNSKEMLEQLIPVFNAANYLTVLDQYEKAAGCYEHIIKTFPSREIYNNTGVALALEGIGLFEAGEIKYVYPFGLDTETRMHNAGTKGMMQESKEERRQRLFEEAKELFEDAVNIDKEYAAGYVNLALINDIMEEPEMSMAMASKGKRLAEKQGHPMLVANAHIARGIALANDDEEDEAEEEFEMAMAGNKPVATINRKVMNNPGTFGYSYKPGASEEIASPVDETIGDVDPSLIEAIMLDAEVVDIPKKNDKHPKIKIFSVLEEEFTAILLKEYTYPKKDIGFIITTTGYTQKSGRGIGIGDSLKKLESKYGKAANVTSTTGGKFYRYDKTPIIFMTDMEGVVTGWILYSL